MGIQVEYNPDLALRSYDEFVAGRRAEAECIPKELSVGNEYPFLKKGQRLYWLHGELPLLLTKGNEQLSRPIASIVIIEATHFVHEGEIWTKGTYRVEELCDEAYVYFEGFSRIHPPN